MYKEILIESTSIFYYISLYRKNYKNKVCETVA
jgi:hypothetical protein